MGDVTFGLGAVMGGEVEARAAQERRAAARRARKLWDQVTAEWNAALAARGQQPHHRCGNARCAVKLSPGRRFCSAACRQIAKREHVRSGRGRALPEHRKCACFGCNVIISNEDPRRVFCSVRCRNRERCRRYYKNTRAGGIARNTEISHGVRP